jgi:hypothetical protein
MSDIYIPIWANSISFKAYLLESKITCDDLKSKITPFLANIKRKKEGWTSASPQELDESKIACFQYVKFTKNANSTRLSGTQQFSSDGCGIIFDFENNIIMPTTSSSQKLASMVERHAFKPVYDLSGVRAFSYSGDFLYWLAYRYETGAKGISENISIKDLIALLGDEGDEGGVSNFLKANTDVSKDMRTKILLGSFDRLSLIHIDVDYNGKTYGFDLREDGRIKVETPDEMDLLEKFEYAKKVHTIVVGSHKEYKDFLKLNTWKKLKDGFKVSQLSIGHSAISELLKKLGPQAK